MGTADSVLYLIVVCFFFLKTTASNPLVTTVINCAVGGHKELGPVDEGFNGTVEELTEVRPEYSLQLVDYAFPSHAQFLELTFHTENSTAIVSTKSPLDADELTESQGKLYYSIRCANNIQNTRILYITDSNDHAPVFDLPEYHKQISESLAVNSEVIQVNAKDADASPDNNRVTYSIVPPRPDELEMTFGGTIVLRKRLNYNIASGYNFTVEARVCDVISPALDSREVILQANDSGGGLSGTATVSVTVEDVDSMNPYFEHSLYTAVIQENETGEFLSILPEAIKARDGDSGINQPVNYSITEVTPAQFTDYLNIDAGSGIITVVNGLDWEAVSMLTVIIKAAQNDDALKTAQAVVSVTVQDVNDNEPEFDEVTYSASIPENSLDGFFVLRVTVTDRDQGGFIGMLRIIPDSVPFSVSPDGSLLVNNSTALDREATPSFFFQIEAEENDSPNHAVLVNVSITLLDVNDNNPEFETAKYEGKINKDQTIGMDVIKVFAEDPDEGANGQVTYAIDGGNQEGHFSINKDTGQIQLDKLIVLEENKSLQFLLFVTARDGGQVSRFSSTQVLILAPGNSNPQFLLPSYHGNVQEEMNPPVHILKLSFLSASPGVNVTLAVLSHSDKFTVKPDGTFSTLMKLDREVQSNYSIQVSISDGTKDDEATVLVDVTDINDNDPIFSSSSVTAVIPEDAALRTNVTDVMATDADDGYNGAISYSLLGGEGKFSIDPNSGRISLTGTLDREERAEFTLKVVAQDDGQPPRSATTVVVVNVTDVNDNSPRFSAAQYEVTIPENFTVGEAVLELTASDLDQGPNADVTYRVVQQTPPTDPPVFLVDPRSGILRLNQPLDFGRGREYLLTVGAFDGGTPALNGTCSVTVRVQDLNDKPPKFYEDPYNISVPESLPSGAIIITLQVIDDDEAGFSEGYFILNSDVFSVNEQGIVSLNSSATLDREEQSHYSLLVVAVDSPSNGLSGTTQLHITVLDVNDNNPQFGPIPFPISIPEGKYSTEAPGVVCQISASDRDQGKNGEVTLSLSNADVPFQFGEDGTLLAVGSLDRERKDAYDLVIMASDHGTPQRKNVTHITVTITDVNDNDPEFTQGTYSKDILLKEAKEGDLVLTLTATDKDAGDNKLISYSFTQGSPLVNLNNETGAITLTSNIAGITEDTSLELTALAQDHGDPQRNSTATVLVSLFTISLTPSVDFESSTYNFTVEENKPAGTQVGVVKASTGSSSAQVNYTLGSHGDLFSVNKEGVVSTLRSLDAEAQAWYSMAVEAKDSWTPPNTAVAMISIQVESVNEAPEFTNASYSAQIFSIAPYKFPIVQVKATDPDAGETKQLEYRLVEESKLFDVELSSGQVYVLSVQGVTGERSLKVKAMDPHGLSGITEVKVVIQESEPDNTVVISLNQPVNMVDKKIHDLKSSLAQILGWKVEVISITSMNTFGGEVRSPRDNVKTYISFIAMSTTGTIIPAEDVERKLRSEKDSVSAELEKIFEEKVEHDLEAGPSDPDSSQEPVIIALGVLLGVCIAVLVALTVTMVLRFRRQRKKLKKFSRASFSSDICEQKADRNSLHSELGDKKKDSLSSETRRDIMDQTRI